MDKAEEVVASMTKYSLVTQIHVHGIPVMSVSAVTGALRVQRRHCHTARDAEGGYWEIRRGVGAGGKVR
ncbi:hypothetical protein BaRGS_00011212, partial [Batillaria attramentaria]